MSDKVRVDLPVNEDAVFDVDLTSAVVIQDTKSYYGTTEYWNSLPELVASAGYIYIYSDYQTVDEEDVAGIKVGDGTTLLKDLPFTDEYVLSALDIHIADTVKHITDTERTTWNAKVGSVTVSPTQVSGNKIADVTVDGNTKSLYAPNELPNVTASDKGKILSVNTSGKWAAANTIDIGRKANSDVGDLSVAEGSGNIASATGAHAEGSGNKATGNMSHTEGYLTEATAYGAHVEGWGAKAKHQFTHVEGYYTESGYDFQHIFGRYNAIVSTDPISRMPYVEVVGYGGGASTRKNIRLLDADGNETITGGFYGYAIGVNHGSVSNVQNSNNNAITNKKYVDDGLALKADASITYTKTEVDTIINNLPEPMIFKGTLGINGTITDLPVAISGNEGFTYKVITDGTYQSIVAKVGDVFTSNGSEWILIPSGDDENDTWREIKVNGTTVLNSAISSGAVDFVEGDNIEVIFNSTGNKVLIKTKNVYTKSEVDTALADKVDSDNVYTKSEIDTMLIMDVTSVGV